EVVKLADALTEAAAELSKTEELRQELVSNVSHDLRTPLTLIAGYSEMIRDLPEETTAEDMQVIIDETNRLSNLVDDLLDLSKLRAGTVDFQMELFDLDELTAEIVGRVARFCEQDGYRIQYRSEAGVQVTGDRERISQVIYNFLLNAVDHAGADKQVTVSLHTGEGKARLEVTDNGAGISSEELPHIWERYYKADKTHHRTKAGSGLGLSIVRSILDRHPGVEYGVETEKGRGSTFWFSMQCG
ncbi:MAG: HAMP domain-containing histidine kinase, partial [Oscillospiraceae bacterium]|nr:HAMP domain-containing histidine kinase [Oscillospiraceae bacterium]